MKRIYSLILACGLLTTVAKAQTMYIDNVFSDVSVQRDINYGIGKLESGTDVDLKFDIYSPVGDSRTDRALILLAHGGSFLPDYGDKSDAYMVDFANAMAKKGYVVACINYREGWAFNPINSQEQNARAILPAVWRAIQDYKTATRFFRKSALADGNPYGINEKLIIGSGFGAGGYLPMNAAILDVPSEITLPELRQKNVFGQATAVPYIDTTKADLGGIFNTTGGSPGYSFRTEFVLNFAGAVATPKTFATGINPLVVSLHSEMDEATPYKTAVVKAAGLFNIIEVSGSYTIANELYTKYGEANKFWTNENRDGLPQAPIADATNGPLNMYQRGLYTFLGKTYMWSTTTDTYDATYETDFRTEMDTVVLFSSYRAEKWIRKQLGVGLVEYKVQNNNGLVKMYPNPSIDVLNFESTDNKQKIREIEILDLTGKIVVNQVISNSGKINIAGLAPGVYTTRTYFDNDLVITDKLVKQ